MTNIPPHHTDTPRPQQASFFQRVIANPLRDGLRNFIPQDTGLKPTNPQNIELAELMKALAEESADKQEKAEQKNTQQSHSTSDQKAGNSGVTQETQQETIKKTDQTPKQSFIDNLTQLLATSQQNIEQQHYQQQQYIPLALPNTAPLEAVSQAILQNNQTPMNYNFQQPQQNLYGQQPILPFMPQTNFLTMGNQQRIFGGSTIPMMNSMNFGNSANFGVVGGHNSVLPNYYQSFFSGSSNLKPLNLEHHKKNPLETSGIGIGMGGIGIGGIGMSDLGFGGFALGGFGGIPPVYF